jgi:phage shock protein A
MKFFDRLALLVKADAHGVLEQLEERSLLAKQHLREAELELQRKRARSEALEDESRRLAEEAERLEAEIAALDEDVALALSRGEEDLARFAVRRLLPKRRAAEELRRRLAEIIELRGRVLAKLESQEREFEELQRKVRARLAALREEDTARAVVAETPVADEEVEIELLRRRSSSAARETGVEEVR